MIPERMLELLCFGFILKNLDTNAYDRTTGIIKGNHNKLYNGNKMFDRVEALIEEFLEPYVIDSTSKE